MKHVIPILLAASLFAGPLSAQDATDDESGKMSEGMNLLQEGTRMLLQGLMQEIGPALEDLEGKIDNLNAYQPPEVLPNGDIIIRRKVPLIPEHLEKDGEVEL